jgi:hypothetical protein
MDFVDRSWTADSVCETVILWMSFKYGLVWSRLTPGPRKTLRRDPIDHPVCSETVSRLTGVAIGVITCWSLSFTLAMRLKIKALISRMTCCCTNMTCTKGSLYKRVLVQTVFVQGPTLWRSPFALERLFLLTDSYASANSINIELSQAQLSTCHSPFMKHAILDLHCRIKFPSS